MTIRIRVSTWDTLLSQRDNIYHSAFIHWGTAIAQLVEALLYKSEGRGFDSRWCHWNFLLT